jgi:hypothetical protein
MSTTAIRYRVVRSASRLINKRENPSLTSAVRNAPAGKGLLHAPYRLPLRCLPHLHPLLTRPRNYPQQLPIDRIDLQLITLIIPHRKASPHFESPAAIDAVLKQNRFPRLRAIRQSILVKSFGNVAANCCERLGMRHRGFPWMYSIHRPPSTHGVTTPTHLQPSPAIRASYR